MADYGNHRVAVFNPAGQFVAELPVEYPDSPQPTPDIPLDGGVSAGDPVACLGWAGATAVLFRRIGGILPSRFFGGRMPPIRE